MGMRWQAAEVHLRNLKTTLKGFGRGSMLKTAEMVRKESWVHLLSYTLLRTLMWQKRNVSKAHPVSTLVSRGKTAI